MTTPLWPGGEQRITPKVAHRFDPAGPTLVRTRGHHTVESFKSLDLAVIWEWLTRIGSGMVNPRGRDEGTPGTSPV